MWMRVCFPLSTPSRLDDKRVHSVLGLSTWVCLFHSGMNGVNPLVSHPVSLSLWGEAGPLATHTQNAASEPCAEQREEDTWLQSQMPQPRCGNISASNRMSKVSPSTWTSQYAEFVQKWWQQKTTTNLHAYLKHNHLYPVFQVGDKNCTSRRRAFVPTVNSHWGVWSTKWI